MKDIPLKTQQHSINIQNGRSCEIVLQRVNNCKDAHLQLTSLGS